MVGFLNNDEIEGLLGSQTIGRIGCNSEGKTYVIPITFVYDGRYIYCHSKPGKKVLMMRSNPQVCFEVDTMSNMANWQSVVIYGKYEELMGREAKKGMEALVNKLKTLMTSETSLSFHDREIINRYENGTNGIVIFRIRIDEKTGRFEKR